MSDGAFPERPRGEPGGIEAAAADLQNAAHELSDGGTTLHGTGASLVGGSWSGQAAGRFGAASSGLAGAYRGAAETLRACAGTLRDYAHALSEAQRVIDAARSEYDQAQVEEATAQAAVAGLGAVALRPHAPHDIDEKINAAKGQAAAASGRAAQALAKALKARADFDRVASRTTSELSGEVPVGAGGLGAPGHGFPGGTDRFTGIGTGGMGALGGGFGVPAGGLAAYTGIAPVASLTGRERTAYLLYLDSKGIQETDDLTNVVLFAVGGPEAKIGESVLPRIGLDLAEEGGEKVVSTVPRKFLSDELTELGAKTSINGLDRDELRTQLQALGVPEQYTKDVADSFADHTAHVKIAGDDTYAYRFHGGQSPEKSFYLSPTFDQGAARARSALPPENTMEHITQFKLKPGTPYVEGRIAPNFGHPGGGIQYYVPDLKNLEPVK